MKINVVLLIIIATLMLHSSVFAIGGNGSTCDPSTPNWGSCTLADVPFAASVTNTVNVDGGTWAVPYAANTANTRYVLQGDVSANSSGFEVSAGYVIIDLNGHTITYNVNAPGEGVVVVNSNIHYIAVRNGSIIQSTTNIGKVYSVSVFNGGSGYTINDILTLDGPTDATVTVTGVSGGVITAVSVTSGGLGFDTTLRNSSSPFAYISGFNGQVTGGTGTGAIIDVNQTVSEGAVYGLGRNTVGNYPSRIGSIKYCSHIHISNLYLRVSGRDVNGVSFQASDSLFEQNTVEDTYQYGTLKDRHAGVELLGTSVATTLTTGTITRNNTLINARHRGIGPGGGSESYGNHITLRSIATNATGISAGSAGDLIIHDNTIIGRGEHPIGIGVTGDSNYHIYNNYMDMQTTALGIEYGSAYPADPSATYISNRADGFRTTWGADNINFHDNTIVITTDDRYVGTYSPTGDVAYVNGGGKGIMAGINAGQTAYFYNNDITVTGDGDYTIGITCSGNASDGLFFINNTVTSNQINIVIGDDYGMCDGYPLFHGNTLIKSGSFAGYATYANTYNSASHHDTARLSENIYQGGASEELISLRPADAGTTDVYFDSTIDDVYAYNYRLHDNSGASSTLLTETFDPAATLSYANPSSPAGGNAAINGAGNIPLSGSGSMTLQ